MVEVFAEIRKWLTLGILFVILGAVSGFMDRQLKTEAVWLQIALQQESRSEMIFRYNYPPAQEEGFTDGRERHGGFRYPPEYPSREQRQGTDTIPYNPALWAGANVGVYEPGRCEG